MSITITKINENMKKYFRIIKFGKNTKNSKLKD